MNGGAVWKLWVDTSRELGRSDPVRDGKDFAAAKALASMGFSPPKLAGIFRDYLRDSDRFIGKAGYPLSMLRQRINAYLNPDDRKTPAEREADRLADEAGRKVELLVFEQHKRRGGADA
jgi:hypothetical protein